MHVRRAQTAAKLPKMFLADRTVALMLYSVTSECRLSIVVSLSVTLCRPIVDKRYVLIEQKLLLTVCIGSRKSIGTKMNDPDLCLQVVLRSRQPLLHIRH